MQLKSFTKSQKHITKANKFRSLKGLDFVLIGLIFIASITAITIAATYYHATQQELSSYVTPIPLTQKEYAKNEVIAGYFEGSKIYNGPVDITRQLSCNDGYIDTLVDLRTGKDYTASILPARTIDGNMPRNIAEVPDEVTVGASCIVAFDHKACIPYLFGCYEQHYIYVSLPFTISRENTGAAIRNTENSKMNSSDSIILNNEPSISNPTVTPQETIKTDPETNPISNQSLVQNIVGGVNQLIAPLTKDIDTALGNIFGSKR